MAAAIHKARWYRRIDALRREGRFLFSIYFMGNYVLREISTLCGEQKQRENKRRTTRMKELAKTYDRKGMEDWIVQRLAG